MLENQSVLFMLAGIQSVFSGDRPQEIFLDAANSEHTTNVASCTYQFDSQMGSLFYDLISVVSVLRWSRIRIPFDFRRNKLNASTCVP